MLFSSASSAVFASFHLTCTVRTESPPDAPVMLMVALPQLIALPLVAALCNIRAVDCRWVLAIGLALLALSCVLGARMSPDWIRTHFYLLQAVQILFLGDFLHAKAAHASSTLAAMQHALHDAVLFR